MLKALKGLFFVLGCAKLWGEFLIKHKSGGRKPAGCPTERRSRRITGGLMPPALALACTFLLFPAHGTAQPYTPHTWFPHRYRVE